MNNIKSEFISNIEEYIDVVRAIKIKRKIIVPWFRGEPKKCENVIPLLPKLFRGSKKSYSQFKALENKLLQDFRLKAYAVDKTPIRENTDEWLFLARHFGLPTRLLDWSDGALIALYFSLLEKNDSVVWVLNPLEMNHLVDSSINGSAFFSDQFPLTWYKGKDGEINLGNINIKAAWENDPKIAVDFPVAVYPPNIHPRLFVQKSCFTIHGTRPDSIAELFPSLLVEININQGSKPSMLKELRMLGISNSTLFPDLDGLCKDLENYYFS
jgi:hypothetical protein